MEIVPPPPPFCNRARSFGTFFVKKNNVFLLKMQYVALWWLHIDICIYLVKNHNILHKFDEFIHLINLFIKYT